jgi:hypothetical protein
MMTPLCVCVCVCVCVSVYACVCLSLSLPLSVCVCMRVRDGETRACRKRNDEIAFILNELLRLRMMPGLVKAARRVLGTYPYHAFSL